MCSIEGSEFLLLRFVLLRYRIRLQAFQILLRQLDEQEFGGTQDKIQLIEHYSDGRIN